MSHSNHAVPQESHLGTYITWGIIIGSIIGLFTGIFWFEMGLSLLGGTAFGLIVGTVIGSIVGARKNQLFRSSPNE